MIRPEWRRTSIQPGDPNGLRRTGYVSGRLTSLLPSDILPSSFKARKNRADRWVQVLADIFLSFGSVQLLSWFCSTPPGRSLVIRCLAADWLLLGVMMMCFRGNRDEFYGEVLLLDGRRLPLTSEQGIKVKVTSCSLIGSSCSERLNSSLSAPQRSSKAAAIFQLVASHLNLVQVQFFGLRFCDNKQRSVRINKDNAMLCHGVTSGLMFLVCSSSGWIRPELCCSIKSSVRMNIFIQTL